MPTPWHRGVYDKVDYVVVERDGLDGIPQPGRIGVEEPAATVDRILRRSYTRRETPEYTDAEEDSDDDEDHSTAILTIPTTSTTSGATLTSGSPAFLITTTGDDSSATVGALADSDPTETIIVAIPPPPMGPHHDRDGRISQTTEHLLIAAGSIGATIIIVMIILALYTMRKRGLTFLDVYRHGKNHVRRRPPPPPSKYGLDLKQSYDDDYTRGSESVYRPLPAVTLSRSGSHSTQRPLQALGRSDSVGQRGLERNGSVNKSFYDDSLSRTNSHRRNDSATPSSPVLPIQNLRRSASTRNTRSLDGDVEALRYSDTSDQRPLPPPPTFRQFLSNRPRISQRPGLVGGIASRFSWTNSNAPQTPHDPSRDTVAQPIGRDSFMTQRSSVPRFRTVDSWVNQQSTRVQEQRLKQQFRMTQSSISSGEGEGEGDDVDKVPEMPAVSKIAKESSGLAGKNIKHQRHDTTTTVQTAPIFRAHPGTEVRFSVRSTVPSEVLDMGRKNAAL